MSSFRRTLLILYVLPVIAAKTTLSPELAALVPSCAQDCFTSFLDFNFALTKCGINPTLDCLCSTKSVSDYTVGEGAVQCVLTASGCSALKDQSATAFKSFTMCVGRNGALPNIHPTLTATLVVPSSTGAFTRTTSTVVLTPSPSLTTSESISTFSISTPSTLITATQTPLISTTSALPLTTSIAAETASSVPKPAGINLTREQTIGISVGSGVGAVAIIFLILFACWRRRRYQGSRDSDMLPFQMDPSNDLNYSHGGLGGFVETRISGPGPTASGRAGKIAPKIPMRLDTSSPNMFSRRSLGPDTIGVAISPEGKFEVGKKQRRTSRLLPEKPSLTLTVPSNEKLALNLSQNKKQGLTALTRGSTATQFEEDFDSADTAVAADDSWAIEAKGQILQIPAGNVATIRQITPEPSVPVPAFMITGGADGNHWRPGQATAAGTTAKPEYQVKPLNLSRGPMGSFSQPSRKDTYPPPARILNYEQPIQNEQQQQVQKPPLSVVVPARSAARPMTNTSSIYSSSLPPSATGPRPQSQSRRSYKAAGPYDKTPRHQSSGSLTSFETLESAVSPVNAAPPPQIQPASQSQRPVLAPINTNTSNSSAQKPMEKRRTTILLDLSPVAESPAQRNSPRSPSSAKGVSPVSYPKIPKQGRLPENTIRMVPPPAQPDFMAVFSSGRTVSQRRRTLNRDGVSPVVESATPIDTATGITPVEASMKPWRVAEIRAQRERERAAELARLPKRESEFLEERSADIEIGMITPEVIDSMTRQQNLVQQQQQQQQQQGTQRIQPFRLGSDSSNPFGPSTSSSTTLPYPPRIQPQLLPQQRRMQQQQQQQQQQRSYFPAQRSQPPLQQQLGASYQAYDPNMQNRAPPRSSTAPPLPTNNNSRNNPVAGDYDRRLLNPSSFPLSHTRSSSVSSTSSSLLAKRRGEGMERGMALNLPFSATSNSRSQTQSQGQNQGHVRNNSNSSKWRVLDAQGKQQAKSNDWRPTLASTSTSTSNTNGNGGTQYIEVTKERENLMNGMSDGKSLGTGDLPKTPGWMPKLTPTRRGDELFLSVA